METPTHPLAKSGDISYSTDALFSLSLSHLMSSELIQILIHA